MSNNREWVEIFGRMRYIRYIVCNKLGGQTEMEHKEQDKRQGKKDNILRLEHVPIGSVRTSPYQPRRFFSQEAIKELAGSIASLGLLQPITVREVAQGYELIAGERRLRACKLLGWNTIPAVIENKVNRDCALLTMIENLQRENLHFFEEAEGYLNLIRVHNVTQEELARRLSKNQSTIANKLRLLRLSKNVKLAVLKYGLTERHARSILRLHDEDTQLRLIEKIRTEGLSVKQTEEMVEKELEKLYGEEKEQKATFKINYRLYYNSVKKLVSRFRGLGEEVKSTYEDKGDSVDIVISFKKKER